MSIGQIIGSRAKILYLKLYLQLPFVVDSSPYYSYTAPIIFNNRTGIFSVDKNCEEIAIVKRIFSVIAIACSLRCHKSLTNCVRGN
jgi:hypothetical protein